MARVSFESASADASNNDSFVKSKFGYFSLKNDNDIAITRIMHDSVDDFDLQRVHKIKVENNGKTFYNAVSCLRDPNVDSVESCPFCKADIKAQTDIFVHMLNYKTNQQTGETVAEPVVWERPFSFAKTLKSKIDDYGALSSQIAKITRHGVSGDTNTTYDVNILSESRYPQCVATDAFNGYNALGDKVLNKTFEEMQTYLTTHKFPSNTNTTANTNTYNPTPQSTVPQNFVPKSPTPNNVPSSEEIPFESAPTYSASNVAPTPNFVPQSPNATSVAPTPNTIPNNVPVGNGQFPWETNGAVSRPQRM